MTLDLRELITPVSTLELTYANQQLLASFFFKRVVSKTSSDLKVKQQILQNVNLFHL